jgi:hypothetical protein
MSSILFSSYGAFSKGKLHNRFMLFFSTDSMLMLTKLTILRKRLPYLVYM